MTSKQNTSKSNEQPVNDSGLSPQQVMEMGQAASQMLNAPIYNAVHSMAVNEIIEAWSTTAPKEVNRREDLWKDLQALGRVAQSTANLVARAEELLQRQNNQQQEQNQEYLNNQGFAPDTQRFQ
jgi:hypothetical protein